FLQPRVLRGQRDDVHGVADRLDQLRSQMDVAERHLGSVLSVALPRGTLHETPAARFLLPAPAGWVVPGPIVHASPQKRTRRTGTSRSVRRPALRWRTRAGRFSFPSGAAEGDDRRAVAPLVGLPDAQVRDRPVAAEVVAHGVAELAGAVAVDDPDLAVRPAERLIEVGVESLQRRLDALADQVDLGADLLDRVVRGRGTASPRAGNPHRSLSGFRPGGPRGLGRGQLAGPAADPLSAHGHLGAVAVEPLEGALPAEGDVAHRPADHERSLRRFLGRSQLGSCREQALDGLGVEPLALALREALTQALDLLAQAGRGLPAERFEVALQLLAHRLALLGRRGQLFGQAAAELFGVRALPFEVRAGLGELAPGALDLPEQAPQVAV